MRIAVVHTRFDRSGGAEGYALRLASGLDARGHEVHAVARRAAGLPPGVVVHPISVVPLGRAIKMRSFARGVVRALRTGRFDIVHGIGRTPGQTVHRASGGLHRAYLQVVPAPRRSAYDHAALQLEDTLFASRDLRAIVCPSSQVARDVARFYPSAARLVRTIPNGVDTTEFSPEGRPEAAAGIRRALRIPAGAPVCLFVAANFWLKGLDVAIEALPLLPDAHLVIVGGDRARAFRSLARGAGVASRVHFAGRQPSMASWYCAADVLLHPTRYDPCSNVCLEAAACGTPVVTTSRDGVSEMLADTGGGLAVPAPAPPEAVAHAAAALLRRGDDARAAARRLAERHTQAAHLDAVEQLYREVTGSGGLS